MKLKFHQGRGMRLSALTAAALAMAATACSGSGGSSSASTAAAATGSKATSSSSTTTTGTPSTTTGTPSTTGSTSTNSSTGPGSTSTTGGSQTNNSTTGSTGVTGSTGSSGINSTQGVAGSTTGSTGGSNAGSNAGSTTGSNGSATTGSSGTTGITVPTIIDPTTFVAPFDAVPDSTASNLFFTAIGVTDGLGHLFSAPASTGSKVKDLTGNNSGLVLPVGVVLSSDDSTAFIADTVAVQTDGTETGGIYTVSAAGGTVSEVSGTNDYTPQGIGLVPGSSPSTDTLYFTGKDPANGKWGAFSIPVAGGTPTVILEGAPLVNPSAITADSSGNTYVIDNQARGGTLYVINAGTATALETGMNVGFPAAVLNIGIEPIVIVLIQDPITGQDAAAEIPVPTGGAPTIIDVPLGIEAGGAHLGTGSPALGAAAVDQTTQGSGAVFLLGASVLAG